MAKEFTFPPVVFSSGGSAAAPTAAHQRRSAAPPSAAASAVPSPFQLPRPSSTSCPLTSAPPRPPPPSLPPSSPARTLRPPAPPPSTTSRRSSRSSASKPADLAEDALLAGKLQFGIILGWVTVAAVFLYAVFNMLAGHNGNLDLYRCVSLIGYCMLPILIFSAVSLFMPQLDFLLRFLQHTYVFERLKMNQDLLDFSDCPSCI